MNVFVLCTGRCGSTTFARACGHMRNYSAAHESRTQHIGAGRLAYPERHIEVDNRLAWFLGRLEREYGSEAFYVHLRRNRRDTAASFRKRYERGLIKGYARYILWRNAGEKKLDHDPIDVCLDYCDTVNTNIEVFLQNKPHAMTFRLENAQQDFERFWERIGAEGNRAKAMAEWETSYNETPPPFTERVKHAVQDAVRKLPSW